MPDETIIEDTRAYATDESGAPADPDTTEETEETPDDNDPASRTDDE